MILSKMSTYVLDPEIVEGAIADAIRELRPSHDTVEAKRIALQADLRKLEDEQTRITGAIAVGGPVDALVAAVKDREHQRTKLQHELSAINSLERFSQFDLRKVEGEIRKRLDEWRSLLRRQTPLSRQVLTRLLDGRIAWTPHKEQGTYEYAGRVKFDKLLSGIVLTQGMVAVRGIEPRFDG